MAVESIDNVLEQVIRTGGSKIDWKDGESRVVKDGQWSIHDHADHKLFDGHLYPAVITRMQCLNLTVGDQAELLVMFDPVTRRIEAMEVWDTDTCGILLTLMFLARVGISPKASHRNDDAVATGHRQRLV